MRRRLIEVGMVSAIAVTAIGLVACAAKVSARSGTPSPSIAVPKGAMYIYTAWALSGHGATQADVAKELAEENAGKTPTQVTQSEDCIACHAPTAVLANGGMSEAQALDYFFTTTDGRFTKDTAPAHTSEWPDVACATCHDPLTAPTENRLSDFNSSTGRYETMSSAEQLCGQCHGNLRFADTDHLSYNVVQGTGGQGVPRWQSMAAVACTSCHMYASPVGGSASAQFAGHSLGIEVRGPGGSITSSCTQSRCHTNWTAAQADAVIAAERSEFVELNRIAQRRVAAATKAMSGVTSATLETKLAEAQHDLTYAESDESGGFHNHFYLMSLLRTANNDATQILAVLGKPTA